MVTFGHVIEEEEGEEEKEARFSSGVHLSITCCSDVKSSAVVGIVKRELICFSSSFAFAETAGRAKVTQASRRSANFWTHALRSVL